MGIIIYLSNMKVEKKNRTLKWLIYVAIKIGIKVISYVGVPYFFRFKIQRHAGIQLPVHKILLSWATISRLGHGEVLPSLKLNRQSTFNNFIHNATFVFIS